MSREEVEAYARTGFVRNGEFCKQPKGIEIIFFARETWNEPEVNSVWFCTPYNPDPECQKTGEDIQNELAKLAVVEDSISGSYRGMIKHPWIKIQTIDANPELDYNKGELDFLRSKPVNPTPVYITEEQRKMANQQFEREQKRQGISAPKQLVKGEAYKDRFTGMTFYKYNLIQLTEGGGEEEHAQPDVREITSRSVKPHWQQAGAGRKSVRRWWENEVSKEPVSSGGD
jgi:hypothetical protein